MSEPLAAAVLAVVVSIALWRHMRPRATTAAKREVMPRDGVLTSPGGRETPVRYERDPDDPHGFVPVDLDGNEVVLMPGARLSADVLGPGQYIRITAETRRRQ